MSRSIKNRRQLFLCFTLLTIYMSIEEIFLEAEIVPDILDRGPKDMLWVTYGTTIPVFPGIELTPAQAKDQPHWVQWVGKVDALYILAFMSLDAVSRANPIYRSVPHWIQINIRGDGKGQGEVDDTVKYFGPGPPKGVGLRRYVFVIHEQIGGRLNLTLENNGPLPYITKLDWKKFIHDNKLSTAPVAGNYFVAQNQDP